MALLENHGFDKAEEIYINGVLRRDCQIYNNEISCKICYKEYSTKEETIIHLQSHTGPPPHTCELCCYGFTDTFEFIEHLDVQHENEVLLYFCQKCDGVYILKDLWHKHTQTHAKNKKLEDIICTPEIPMKVQNAEYESMLNVERKQGNENESKKVSLCCYQCGKIIGSDTLMFEHMKSHSRSIGIKRYECQECKKKFSSRSGLTVHVRKHTQKLLRECFICNKLFPTQSSLSQHMNRHLNVRTHRCNYCTKSFSSRHSLNNHILTHTGELPYQCLTCGTRYRQSAHLKRHALKHGNQGPFSCKMCDKVYLNEENLIKHLNENLSCKNGHENIDMAKLGKLQHVVVANGRENNIKPVGKTRYCCGKMFYDAPSYATHLQIHPPESFESCKECGRKFVNMEELKVHLLKHQQRKDKVQQCEDCGQIFTGKQSLIYHRMRYHLGRKGMIKCDKCERMFVTHSDLKTHLSTHTGEKTYTCMYCSKKFRLSATLKIHTKIHLGKKDYKCDICGKCFSQQAHLKRHEVVHTGEKKYQCSICLRAFSQNGDLTKHYRIHTGITPYVCQCGRKFNQKNSLTKHCLQNPSCGNIESKMLQSSNNF